MKVKMLAAALAMGLCLVACGEEENDARVINGEVVNQDVNKEVDDTDVQISDDEPETVSTYVFSISGVNFSVDDDSEAVAAELEKAGVALQGDIFESSNCAIGEVMKTYTYASFSFETYTDPKDNVDKISNITLKDDMVGTTDGVVIGQDLDAVTAVYGTEYTQNGNAYIYTDGVSKITFIIIDGVIASIQYDSLAYDF